jgi:hypothetical protein
VFFDSQELHFIIDKPTPRNRKSICQFGFTWYDLIHYAYFVLWPEDPGKMLKPPPLVIRLQFTVMQTLCVSIDYTVGLDLLLGTCIHCITSKCKMLIWEYPVL